MLELLYPSGHAPVIPSPRSYLADQNIVADDEILPVVESSGVVIGQSSRQYVHTVGNLMHPVVHMHIIDRDGSLYLQKRAASKSLYPGMWDIAVGGHVSYGENIEETLVREASEELNFRDFNPLEIKSFRYESGNDVELVCLFATVGHFDINPISLEVDGGRYWARKEIEENLGKSVFTPTFEYEYRQYYGMLEALL